MSSASPPYAHPPRPTNAAGQPRRVGVEVEFAGLQVPQIVEVVLETLGGTVHRAERLEAEVDVPELGRFRVELDSTIFRDRKLLSTFGLDPEDHGLLEVIEDVALRAAIEVVPHEVVTPPIPWPELARVEPLWAALAAAGAQGTQHSVFYAFGLHFNPELPDLEVPTVLRYLRAYLLLEPRIRELSHIDWTRRVIMPHIDPFPASFRARVLHPAYAPDLDVFIEDYLHDNATRDRSLDLLPLLTHLKPECIEGRVEQEHLVKPRPTFHYRLPNCELGRPSWSPATAWNRWVEVERLAEDPERLTLMTEQFLRDGTVDPSLEPSGPGLAVCRE